MYNITQFGKTRQNVLEISLRKSLFKVLQIKTGGFYSSLMDMPNQFGIPNRAFPQECLACCLHTWKWAWGCCKTWSLEWTGLDLTYTDHT